LKISLYVPHVEKISFSPIEEMERLEGN